MKQFNTVDFNYLSPLAEAWFLKEYPAGHKGVSLLQDKVLLMALSMAVLQGMRGGEDLACFVVDRTEGNRLPADGTVNFENVRVLRVDEDLKCWISKIGGPENSVKAMDLLYDYGFFPINATELTIPE